MGLTDLNFSSVIPGAGGIGPDFANDPIGAYAYLEATDGTGYSLKLANFSTGLDGSDWYKVFPYQFILIDRGEQLESPAPFDESKVDDGFVAPSDTSGFSLASAASLDQSDISDADDAALSASSSAKTKRDAAEAAYKKKLAKRESEDDQNSRKVIYTLPIPPDGLTIQPMFASEVMASLGGVVEETSPTVFWMITLSGTTGMAVGRNDTDTPAGIFRDVLSTTGLLAGLGSSLSKLASTVTNVVDAGSALIDNPSASGVADLANAALLPKLPYSESAVSQDYNGYLEINLMHRFLNSYGDLKAKRPNGAKLVFVNYKDGQQWQVIVKQFRIQKSVNEPMLYRYQIVLQGWDLKDPNEAQGDAIDRFSTDLKSVNTTTITGLVSSANSLVTNTIGNPNNIVPLVP